MNKTRLRKTIKSSYQQRSYKRSKDWVRSWLFSGCQFPRLNPNE